MEPTSGLKQSHLPGMMKHVEELKAENIEDNKPLSRIVIKTDDEDLLAALGDSGIRMASAEDGSGAEEGSDM